MTTDGSKWRPGWYVHPEMTDTLCFWDGSAWTEQVAPALPTPPAVQQITFRYEQTLAFVLFLILMALAAVVVLLAIAVG